MSPLEAYMIFTGGVITPAIIATYVVAFFYS